MQATSRIRQIRRPWKLGFKRFRKVWTGHNEENMYRIEDTCIIFIFWNNYIYNAMSENRQSILWINMSIYGDMESGLRNIAQSNDLHTTPRIMKIIKVSSVAEKNVTILFCVRNHWGCPCLRYGYWQKAKRNCFTLISCFFTLGHHVTLEEKIITSYAANGHVLCYLLKTCNIWPLLL